MQLYFNKKLTVAPHLGAVLGNESNMAFFISVNLSLDSQKKVPVITKSHIAEVHGIF